MKIAARRASTTEVTAMREAYRTEAGCQIIYDSFLLRGLADAYAISIDGIDVGYGAVATRYYPRHAIEFYIAPHLRIHSLEAFRELLNVSRASHVRAQTNMPLMTRLLFDTTKNIAAEKVLFADGLTKAGPSAPPIPAPEASKFRHITPEEKEKFSEAQEVLTDWVLEVGGEIVATAGYLTHYNPPYGDIFMAVSGQSRRKGYGGYIVQEICKIAREAGKTPAARCDPNVIGSRRALERGGLVACGHLAYGEIAS
jgi:GNAT superfamily N-acetyltransferase